MIIFILNLTVIVKVKVLYMKKDKNCTPAPKALHMHVCDACDKFQVWWIVRKVKLD